MMSDLNKVAGDKAQFLANTVRLIHEKLLLGVKLKPELSEQLRCDCDYLLGFFSKNYTFTTRNRNKITNEDFMRLSMKNIEAIGSVPTELIIGILGVDICQNLPASWFANK